MQIHLNNSLTRKIEPFEPLAGNEVRMYSCGPTVYNFAHIGNMRSFLFADLLQRVMRVVGGYSVKWVMNITNIDDKTIRDSSPGSSQWKPEMGEQNENPLDNLLKFTQYYEKSFVEDINELGIKREHFFYMPKATEFISQMQDLIKSIYNKGLAYVSEGSVYFDLNKWRKVAEYGRLFKIDFDNFRAGTRVDTDQYEREQVSDFVLWKARKDNEPFWEYTIDGKNCDGRPGWHIECSAMEKELLGLPFDIHTGGIDLKFPHHEDEIAQSMAGYDIDPTRVWCHNEFLEVEGEKMSKSLGNYFTLRDLKDKGIDPLDIRYSVLSAHYGSVYNFTMDGLSAAHKGRFRIQDYIYDLHEENEGTVTTDVDKLKENVFSELASDLHTPKALANLFSFINANNPNSLSKESKVKLISFFKELNNVFDVWTISARPQENEPEIPAEVIAIAEERLEARKNKDFAASDVLRNKLLELGYAIKDKKDGYDLERVG
jgi:cysteinyl-tRNA synthetase